MKKMPETTTRTPNKLCVISLSSASLAPVVVVEASLPFVPVAVFIATVLEIFHRLGQKIFLLLALRL